jgi:hypothetical protein
VIGAVALATALLTSGVASAAGEETGVASVAASSITSAGQPDFGPNVKILLQSSKAPTQPGSAAAAVSICPDASSSLFGPNVCVFNPSMSQAAIQADVDRIATLQVPIGSQFSTNRYAIFFEPGTYGSAANPLVFQVGYYTQVAGLGFMPQDTVVNGMIEVFANDCATRTRGSSTSYWCNSTTNFWRSLSNLQLNVTRNWAVGPAWAPTFPGPYGAGCAYSEEAWSVSQAAPLRRLLVNGSIVFQDYCSGANDDASGGFIADSQITGNLNFNGQQQYYTRDSQIGAAHACPNGLWNEVYSGVVGAPAPVFSGSCQQNTVVPSTSTSEEQPFLYKDSTGWHVFVPAVRHDSVGTSWGSGPPAGSSLPLSSFFIASPSTSASDMTSALAKGKNLILTPGIYALDDAITAPHPDAVILGLGFATLVPQNGDAALKVVSNKGVKLAGFMVDAGPVNSDVLVSVGTPGQSSGSATNPDLISDVFFRIGGATLGKARVSLLVNADNAILDDVWAWRADHGNPGTVGWNVNTADTGLVVTGDNVTATGLFVEHYQKNEVIWSGQGGNVVFFQNELPYDPPTQADWMASPTQNGYPALLVTPNVKTFSGTGMGSYVVFIQTTATIYDDMAFQAPQTPGVQFNNLLGVWISGSGGLNSIINGVGGPVTSTNPGTAIPVDLAHYPLP